MEEIVFSVLILTLNSILDNGQLLFQHRYNLAYVNIQDFRIVLSSPAIGMPKHNLTFKVKQRWNQLSVRDLHRR
jgi:hypothetical protein